MKDLERLKALSEAGRGEFDTLDDAEGEVFIWRSGSGRRPLAQCGR
jgi:hypothetical protein